jgi:hypothetical protein
MKHSICVCYDAVEWIQYEIPEEGLGDLSDLLWKLESEEIPEIEESTITYLNNVRTVSIDGLLADKTEIDIDPDYEEPDIQTGLWRMHWLKKVFVNYELELPDDEKVSAYCLKINEEPYTIQYQIGDDGDNVIELDGEFVSDEGDYDNHVFLDGKELDLD